MSTEVAQHAGVWRIAPDRALTLHRVHLIGILNVTPDSFSDGGAYSTVNAAVDAALRMHEQGASIIDVGGESTRPGAQPVDAAEQMRRALPVIESIRLRLSAADLLISIDTTQSETARAALDAGADVINDVSAGRDDPEMLPLVASRGCGLVLMHRLTAPRLDSYSDRYATPPDYGGDVVNHVRRFLAARCEAAIAAGVARDAIVIDPGLGFGKSVQQSLELVGRIGALAELSHPVLGAASRKSFVGAASGVTEPSQRLAGTLAVHLAMWRAGVRLFRVHDVAAHRQAFDAAAAIDAPPTAPRRA